MNGLTGENYLAIRLNPLRFSIGQYLSHSPPGDLFGFQTGYMLECGVYLEETIVNRVSTIIQNNLMYRKAVNHPRKELPVPFLAFPESLFRLFSLGNISEEAKRVSLSGNVDEPDARLYRKAGSVLS